MKNLIFLFSHILLFVTNIHAQALISKVEGRLEVYHPIDSSSMYIGLEAGRFAQSNGEKNNTFVGTTAGFATTSGVGNTFVGGKSGLLNKEGSANSFFGTESGHSNDNANFNSFYGVFSGKNTKNGSYNSFFGASSGITNTIGYENAYYGWATGGQNVNGYQNSFFGSFAGNAFVGGANNTCLGYKAGHRILFGFNNICLGNFAGPPNTNAQISNRLYIDVEETNTPLIYGEFDIDQLQINGSLVMGNTNYYNGGDDALIRSSSAIGSDLFLLANDAIILQIGGTFLENGTFEVWNKENNDVLLTLNEAGNLTAKGTINGSSDVNRKEHIHGVDMYEILAKVANLPISEWQYKGEEDIRHIGPMAQDFCQTFGLGENETTIAMVDADGVALAAIKALAEKNDRLELRQKQLESEVAYLRLQLDFITTQLRANKQSSVVEDRN